LKQGNKMSKESNQAEFKLSAQQMANVSKELYAGYGYSSGYFQSVAEMMFANLSTKQQEHYLRILQGGVIQKMDELKRTNSQKSLKVA